MRRLLFSNGRRASQTIFEIIVGVQISDISDVHPLLVVECDALISEIRASNFPHESVACGVFSGSLFGARAIVGCYYETLVQSQLTLQKQARKTYLMTSFLSPRKILQHARLRL